MKKLTLAFVFVATVGHISAQQSPNLLFIMTDQQRFDAMSCAGNKTLNTPNMDRLAREGVMFTNAYVANPVCVPSRASFLTGLTPVNVRVESNRDATSDEIPKVPTFDSVLKNAGYRAEYYGKWHAPYDWTKCYDNTVNPVGRGFGVPHVVDVYQDWLDSKGVPRKEPGPGELYSGRNRRPYTPIPLDYSDDKARLPTDEKMQLRARQVTQYGRIDLPPKVSYAAFHAEQTLEALERMKGGPFTLTCSFDPPHPPMVVQEPYYSMYPPERISVPENIDDPMTHSPYRERSNQEDQMKYKNPSDIQQMRSIYYGMVKEVDDWIGEILDKLDELGLADNTLVIFTSDHGEMLGDHGMHSKMIFYEGSVHVPLLMRFPGRIEAGTTVDQPVSTMDVFATILDYLAQPIPDTDGTSLRPLVEGTSDGRDVVSFSVGQGTPNYMIRSGNLKLMIGEGPQNDGVDALYDLEADPLEIRNLLKAPIEPQGIRQQAQKMKERLVQWMEEHEPHKASALRLRTLF